MSQKGRQAYGEWRGKWQEEIKGNRDKGAGGGTGGALPAQRKFDVCFKDFVRFSVLYTNTEQTSCVPRTTAEKAVETAAAARKSWLKTKKKNTAKANRNRCLRILRIHLSIFLQFLACALPLMVPHIFHFDAINRFASCVPGSLRGRPRATLPSGKLVFGQPTEENRKVEKEGAGRQCYAGTDNTTGPSTIPVVLGQR